MKDIARENFVLNSKSLHGSDMVEKLVECLKDSFIQLEFRGNILCYYVTNSGLSG